MDGSYHHTFLRYLKEVTKYPWHLSNLTALLRLNTFIKIDLYR